MNEDPWATLLASLLEVVGRLGAASVADDLMAESRPCLIFHSNVGTSRAAREPAWPEPPVGASKIGGSPDLPPNESWPRNSVGELMDFVLQVNLAEAPALPQFLSDTRLWVFIGDDEGRYGVEHALIVHPPETGLVCTPRPDGPRMERSLDYRPLPARWVPSLAIKSEGRYFGPGKVAEYELQEAIDRAALDLAGLDSSGFGAGSSLSRLGGWPAGEPRLNEGFMPMVAQVFDSGFGGEVWDLYFADSPSTWFDEHRDLLFAGQYDRRQAGGPFFDWYRTLEPAQIARSWRQVLSIDSHIETDLNFWDCATLEFVVPSDEMAKGSLARSHVSVWDGG